MREIVFERSFASHTKSKFWSKLNDLKPYEVYKCSGKKYLFNCDKCNHEFELTPAHIIHDNNWCPYCVNQKLCEKEDCKECFNKSFASNDKSKFWSNKNKITPSQIFKSSGKKIIFNCDKCNHEFIKSLDKININQWCPYCIKPSKILCKNNECKECFERSFASNIRCKFWSDKNQKSPREISIRCGNKFQFKCENNHEFESRLDNNAWCPFCKNKTEGILHEWLKENYENIIYQPRFDWCKDKRKLPFDFLLEEFKLIIELDGAQHFKQVSNWKSPEETQIVDKFKTKSALENGYSLIRVKQDDVWNNKIDWQNILINSIKLYETPQTILHY